jgi:hypothetical protein
MTAPGNLFDNIYSSRTPSGASNMFDSIYKRPETEEEKRQRQERERQAEARRQAEIASRPGPDAPSWLGTQARASAAGLARMGLGTLSRAAGALDVITPERFRSGMAPKFEEMAQQVTERLAPQDQRRRQEFEAGTAGAELTGELLKYYATGRGAQAIPAARQALGRIGAAGAGGFALGAAEDIGTRPETSLGALGAMGARAVGSVNVPGMGQVSLEPAAQQLERLAQTPTGRAFIGTVAGAIPETAFAGAARVFGAGRRMTGSAMDQLRQSFGRRPSVEDVTARAVTPPVDEAARAAATERLMAEQPSPISQAMRQFQEFRAGYGPRALELPVRPEAPAAPSVREGIEAMRDPFVRQARAEQAIAENAAQVAAGREGYRQTVRGAREAQLGTQAEIAAREAQAAQDALNAPTIAQRSVLERLRERAPGLGIGLAQAGTGAGIGFAAGETPEERAQFAMLAAGVAGVPRLGGELAPMIPQEVRATGRFGFVRLPENAVPNMALEQDHLQRVLQVTEPILRNVVAPSVERPVGIGYYKRVRSPNSQMHFDATASDEAVRKTAAVQGLSYGQDAQVWLREARPEDTRNVVTGIRIHEPNKAPLNPQAVDEVIEGLKAPEMFGEDAAATIDKNGHLLVMNFSDMSDQEFRVKMEALLQNVVPRHNIDARFTNFYSEYLDGPTAYLRVIGRDRDALQRARDAIVGAGPEYRRYAEAMGADGAAVEREVAARVESLDRLIRQVDQPPPLGEKAGRITVAEAAEKVYRQFTPLPAQQDEVVVPEMVNRFEKLVDDLVTQGVIPREMAQDWYRGATLDQRKIARLALPELREDPKYTLYTIVNSILSSGQKVPVESRQGLNVFNQYLKTKRFSILDPEGAQYKQALTGGKKGFTGWRGGGLGEAMAASPRTLNHEQALARLDSLVQAYGEEGAIEALVGTVPIMGPGGKVVKEERPALVYLFGPKIGQYAMDKLGIPGGGKSTIDLWMARMDYALRGDPSAIRGNKLNDTVLPTMRRRMQSVLAEFAARHNMPESGAQALGWYAIKNAFRNAGAKEDRLAYATLGSGTTEAMLTGAGELPPAPLAQGLMTPGSYERAIEGWDDSTLRKFAKATGREGTIRPTAGPFTGKVFDIGGALGEGLRTPEGRRLAAKGGVIGAGELVETIGEGEEGSPQLRATGQAMKVLGGASLIYPALKRGGKAAGGAVRDAMAQTPQGRRMLGMISKDIQTDPRVKEIVENGVLAAARDKALGRELIAEAQRVGGPEVERIISDIVERERFESAVLNPDDMAAAIAVANRIADAVQDRGRRAVSAGLMSEATYRKRERTWLPRMYGKYEGQGVMAETPSGVRTEPYRIEDFKRRLDLTPEQRNELGEIREISYRLAEAFGPGGRNIATANMFQQLSDVPGVVEPRYKQAVDAVVAARQAGNADATREAARSRLEAKAQLETIRKEFAKGDQYVTLPDTPGLGVLRKAVVRRDAADFLVNVDDFEDTRGTWNKLLQTWKKIKTVYNLSTHGGNFASNAGVAQMNGLWIPLQPYYLKKAADAFDPSIVRDIARTTAGGVAGVAMGETPEERLKYGVAGAGIAAGAPTALRRAGILKGKPPAIKYDPDVKYLTENGVLERGLPLYGVLPVKGLADDKAALRTLMRTTRPETRKALEEQGLKPMGNVELAARKLDATVTRAYSLEDGIYRVALFKYLKDRGVSNEQALVQVKEAFPSYETRSPILKAIKNIYSPFVMFTAKYVPAMVDKIMEHPERWVLLAALWGGLDDASRREYGAVDPKDLPENQRNYNYLIPGRIQVDAIARPAFEALGVQVPEGDKYTFDVARWTPFSAFTGSPAPGMVASQLDIGLPAIAQPGGPAIDLAALALGVDPFTGEKTIQPGMSGRERAMAVAGQAASIATPSMASFQIPRIMKDLERGDAAAAATDALALVGLRPQVVRKGIQGIRERKKYEDAVRSIKTRRNIELRKSRDPEYRRRITEEAAQNILREAEKYKAIINPEVP